MNFPLTMCRLPIHAGNCPKPIAGSCATNFTDGTFCGTSNLQYEWSAFREISYGHGGCCPPGFSRLHFLVCVSITHLERCPPDMLGWTGCLWGQVL